jgi:hypothetical protein
MNPEDIPQSPAPTPTSRYAKFCCGKFLPIFLFVLIIIGLGLLATQKMWVPRLVDRILSQGEIKTDLEFVPVPEVTKDTASSPEPKFTEALISTEQNAIDEYLNGELRVIKKISTPQPNKILYIAAWGANNSCGSGYYNERGGQYCYFFLEWGDVYGKQLPKYIGKWKGGMMGFDENNKTYFVDSSNFRFETHGGDAGEFGSAINNLNIDTGELTRI